MKIQHNTPLLDDRLANYRKKYPFYYRRMCRDSHKNHNDISGTLPDLGDGRTEQTDPTAVALSARANLGLRGLKRGDLRQLLGQDKMEPTFEVMAAVQAYAIQFNFSACTTM